VTGGFGTERWVEMSQLQRGLTISAAQNGGKPRETYGMYG